MRLPVNNNEKLQMEWEIEQMWGKFKEFVIVAVFYPLLFPEDRAAQGHHISWIRPQLLNLGEFMLSGACQAWPIYSEM